MNVPEQVTNLARVHGFNSVELVRHTSDENVYSVCCVDGDGLSLPAGLPHYIIDRNGILTLTCDDDFRITDSL